MGSQLPIRVLSQIWLQVQEESRFFFWTPQYFDNMQDPTSKSGNFKFFSHEIWQLWAIFGEKILYMSHSPFFQSAIAKILPLKKKSCTVNWEKFISIQKSIKSGV
jgi:hypothetical protein